MAKQKPLAADVRNNYYYIDSRRLVVDESFIEREDYGDIEAIATWIMANGAQNLNPLRVYKKGEQYVIIRGHRRKKALTILEERFGQVIMVPIIVDKKGANLEQRYFEQATENDSKQYTPWEKAKVLKRARNFGWSIEKMVEESGWSITYVKRLLALADAPEKLIKLIREGRVKGTFAMDMIAEGKVQEVIEVAEKNPPTVDQDDIGDLFSQHASKTEKPPSTKITKSDIQRPNSVKVFKKWVPKVQEEQLPAEKKEILHWLKRMVAGELTIDELNEFFA